MHSGAYHPASPVWTLRGGCAGLVVGLVAPPAEAQQVRKVLPLSRWYVIEMWSPAAIGGRAGECHAICMAPPPGDAAGDWQRFGSALEALRSDAPFVCYGTPEGGARVAELVRALGRSPASFVLHDLEKMKLYEVILEAVLQPFFEEVGDRVHHARDDLDAELLFLLRTLVTQEVPSFEESIRIARERPSFVRHASLAHLLVPHGRTHVFEAARRSRLPLGRFHRLNTVLHGLARYDPDRRRKHRLALRLGFPSERSLEEWLRRAAGHGGLREALDRPLAAHVELLLELLRQSG